MFWKQRNSNQEAIDAIFLWLNGIATERDAILMDSSGRKEFFYFDFPLRYGDKPKKTKTLPAGREITFIIRKPQGGEFAEESEWAKIFGSSEIEILENRARFSRFFPLRWRLNKEEKKAALKIARDALEKFLTDGRKLEQAYFNNLPPRFYLETYVDVAIWAKGQLRGSAVVENFNLGEAIAEAAALASRDRRFKPLSKEELEITRIEITIMERPFIPISFQELERNRIYPDKGYLLKREDKRGWFLPEVFNVRRFSGLEEFLGELAYEKAGLARGSYKESELFIFEVDDFIESENRSSAIDLFGPIAKDEKSSVHNRELAIKKMRAAADWLCRIQEPDGNMPPITDPLTGRQTQIDLPRLAFTAWALAEFGKAINEKKYLDAAERGFEYLKKYLTSYSDFPIPNGMELAMAYLGKLALALGKEKDTMDLGAEILKHLSNLNFEPIKYAQIAGFFKILRFQNSQTESVFNSINGTLKDNFKKEIKENKPMNLAVWAELVNLSLDIDREFSHEVLYWLKFYQLPDGAFAESTISNFSYTRGTGKIFEVLALEPEKNKEAIGKALDWLLSMQYNAENTFFIPEGVRPRIIGGFRHDYFNPEAWIDAAGHILLGASELVKSKKLMINE